MNEPAKRKRKGQRGPTDVARAALDWTIRGDKLPTDFAVDKYLKNRLRDDFSGNLFEAVRDLVALAVGRAEMAKQSDDRLRMRDETLDRYGRQARDLADSIQMFLEAGRRNSRTELGWFDALTDRTVRGTIRPVDAEQNARFDTIDSARSAIASAMPALRTIAGEADERLSKEGVYDKRIDPFRRGFIEQLALGLTNLCKRGLRPTTRIFAYFVGVAIETASEPSKFPPPKDFYLKPWDPTPFRTWLAEGKDRKGSRDDWFWTQRQCSEVLKEMAARPEWDRPDRYVKDSWPPGTPFPSAKEFFERQARGKAAQDADIREAIRAIEQGGSGATTAAMLLMRAYEIGTESLRKHYVALGFRQEAVLTALLAGLPSETIKAILQSEIPEPALPQKTVRDI